MTRTRQVSADVVVAATPAAVYALVSDPTQTPRWSPENTGAVLHAALPLAVGDEFDGRNRRHGVRWITRSVVTAAEPDRRFAFRVHRWGLGRPLLRVRNASWEYRLEPVEGGTRVTETWTDDRNWPDALAAVLDRVLTRSPGFAAYQRRNLRTSLDRLRSLVES